MALVNGKFSGLKFFASFAPLREIIRQNPWFFSAYAVFLLIATIMLFMQHDKGQFLLWLNSHNSPFFDTLFRFTNKMGEGAFYILVLVCLLAVRISYSIYGALCLILTGFTTQFLKLKVFADVQRPAVWFQGKTVLHFVPGVPVIYLHSFPSGHTATAFTLFCFLSLITKYKPLGAVFLFMGVFAGLARIYLAEHFLIDVYFGSMVGTGVAMFIYWLVEGHYWFNDHPKLAAPLYKRVSRKVENPDTSGAQSSQRK